MGEAERGLFQAIAKAVFPIRMNKVIKMSRNT
jgi:hypothetical protein